MSRTLHTQHLLELRTASAPAAVTTHGGRLAVLALDLTEQAPALWLLDEDAVVGPQTLPVEHATGLADCSQGLLATGVSPEGDYRLLLVDRTGATRESLRLPVVGSIVTDPRPYVSTGAVIAAWEEHDGVDSHLVVQRVGMGDRGGIQLLGEAVRRRIPSFALSSDVALGSTHLVIGRADDRGATTIELCDVDLRVTARSRLPSGRDRIAVAANAHIVVVSADSVGGAATLQAFDQELCPAGAPVTLPILDHRATVGALAVSTANRASVAIVLQVETVLDDSETIDRGAGPEMAPAKRHTTERCTAVDLAAGEISDPVFVDPPTFGCASLVSMRDRVWIVHGSSPLNVSSLTLSQTD